NRSLAWPATIRIATVAIQLATAATGRRTTRYASQSQGDFCFVMTGVPSNSQKIPQRATATPSSTSCTCQKLKASRDLSFGNGHKLLGMNALLFIIAPVANSSAVGNGLARLCPDVGHPEVVSKRPLVEIAPPLSLKTGKSFIQ